MAEEIVAGEFQWVSRESDVLLRASSPTEGAFLMLTEMQLRHDPWMPWRMQAYAALAEERYHLPAYPVLVNILPPPAGVAVADRHERTFLGLQARRDYRVINLWEVEARLVLDQPLPTLLPFVPVPRGGDDEAVVRSALRALRADAHLSDLEPLLAFFASFVLHTRIVQQIMRWDMAVLEQSPWYREILERGREEGRETALREQIARALVARFGVVPPDLATRVAGLSLEQLHQLVEAAYTDDSLARFQARLTA